jgi:hypothetical protein
MKLTERAYRIWIQNPDLDYGFICKLCKIVEEAKKDKGEFKLSCRSLEEQGLRSGDKLKCTYSNSNKFTIGKEYTITNPRLSAYLCIVDNEGKECLGYEAYEVKFKKSL